MIKITVWLLATIIGAILYRCGGVGKPYNTKFRDFGVPTVGILLLTILGGWHWIYILCFGLYFGSMTTYWKKKGSDAKWWNWLLTGLGYSLAFLPFAIFSGHWLGFLLRTVIVSVGTMLWSEKVGNVVWEECGRGVITTITLPYLLFI